MLSFQANHICAALECLLRCFCNLSFQGCHLISQSFFGSLVLNNFLVEYLLVLEHCCSSSNQFPFSLGQARLFSLGFRQQGLKCPGVFFRLFQLLLTLAELLLDLDEYFRFLSQIFP